MYVIHIIGRLRYGTDLVVFLGKRIVILSNKQYEEDEEDEEDEEEDNTYIHCCIVLSISIRIVIVIL